MQERNRDDWIKHLHNIKDICNTCMLIPMSCDDCTKIHGACRRNMAILELSYIIHEYFDLVEKRESDD